MTSLSLVRWSCFSRTASMRSLLPNRSSPAQRAIHTPLPRPLFRSSSIFRREFRHLHQEPKPSSQSSPSSTSQNQVGKIPRAPSNPSPPSPTPAERELSTSEQRRNDWAIIKRLLVHIWPRDDWGVRGRVMFGVGLLIAGKVCPRPGLGFNER